MPTIVIEGDFQIRSADGTSTGASAPQQLFLHHVDRLGGQAFDASALDLYPLTYVDDDGRADVLRTPEEVGLFADTRFAADAEPFVLRGNHFVRQIRDAIIVLPLKLTLLTAKDAELPIWDEIRVFRPDRSPFVVNAMSSYPVEIEIGDSQYTLQQPVDWYLQVLRVAYGFTDREITNFVLGGPSNSNLVQFETPLKLDKRTPDEVTVK